LLLSQTTSFIEVEVPVLQIEVRDHDHVTVRTKGWASAVVAHALLGGEDCLSELAYGILPLARVALHLLNLAGVSEPLLVACETFRSLLSLRSS